MLRQEAAEAIAKLKSRKYRRKARDLNCSTNKRAEQERKDAEVCAVCLDEFHNNQVRVKRWLKSVNPSYIIFLSDNQISLNVSRFCDLGYQRPSKEFMNLVPRHRGGLSEILQRISNRCFVGVA